MSNQPKPRGWRRLEELVENISFLEDVKKVRSHNQFMQAVETSYLMTKYDIPTNLHLVVEHFVADNHLDPSLAGKYVEVLDGDGVNLRLSFDITQDQLLKYVGSHWKDEIEPALEKKFGKRKKVSGTSYPTRDADVYKAHMERKFNGKTAKDIQIEFGLHRSRYYDIIKRQKGPTNS